MQCSDSQSEKKITVTLGCMLTVCTPAEMFFLPAHTWKKYVLSIYSREVSKKHSCQETLESEDEGPFIA